MIEAALFDHPRGAARERCVLHALFSHGLKHNRSADTDRISRQASTSFNPIPCRSHRAGMKGPSGRRRPERALATLFRGPSGRLRPPDRQHPIRRLAATSIQSMRASTPVAALGMTCFGGPQRGPRRSWFAMKSHNRRRSSGKRDAPFRRLRYRPDRGWSSQPRFANRKG
jgi:hypothetical protein